MKKIIVLVLFLITASLSFAQESTTAWCVDNNTLGRKVYRVICIDDVCDNVTRESYEYCQWGCNIERNECYEDPTTRWFWVIIIVFVLLIVIYFIRRML